LILDYESMFYFYRFLLLTSFVHFALPCVASSSETTQFIVHQNRANIACDTTAQRCVTIEDSYMRDPMTWNGLTYSIARSTEDGGLTWSKPKSFCMVVNRSSLTTASCNGTGSTCVIGGLDWDADGMVLFVRKDQSDWRRTQAFGSKWMSIKLACSTTENRCILLGNLASKSFVSISEDGGMTWSQPSNLPQPENTSSAKVNPIDMSCSDSGLVCMIVGGMKISLENTSFEKPISYITTDGGHAWRFSELLEESDNKTTEFNTFSNVSCNDSGSECIALRHQKRPEGSIIDTYMTMDGGVTWEKTSNTDNNDGILHEPVSHLRCDKTNLNYCVAIINSSIGEKVEPVAYISHDKGRTWTLQSLNISNNQSRIRDMFCDEHLTLCRVAR